MGEPAAVAAAAQWAPAPQQAEELLPLPVPLLLPSQAQQQQQDGVVLFPPQNAAAAGAAMAASAALMMHMQQHQQAQQQEKAQQAQQGQQEGQQQASSPPPPPPPPPQQQQQQQGLGEDGAGGSQKRKPWSTEEDETIALLVEKVGCFLMMTKKRRRGVCVPIDAHIHTHTLTEPTRNPTSKQHGTKSWTVVANELNYLLGATRRTGKQCRTRYFNMLDPSINKQPWTEEEERVIQEAQQMYGNKWAKIAQLLPGRSDNSIKVRVGAGVVSICH